MKMNQSNRNMKRGRESKEVGNMDSNQETGNKIFFKVQMDQQSYVKWFKYSD